MLFVRDVMTTNVVTVSSNTSLADARRIVDAHRIRRIPVVDRGKLVGIVTRDALDKAGPSKLTTFSIHELSYLLGTLTVKDSMVRDVVTISPGATVEQAIALSQSKKVGALVVVEDDRVVGITTTNDFFYKIMNPLLGIGKPGTRIDVHNCGEAAKIGDVVSVISKYGHRILNMFMMSHPDTGLADFMIHLDTPDPSKVMAELKARGFEVHETPR